MVQLKSSMHTPNNLLSLNIDYDINLYIVNSIDNSTHTITEICIDN